MDTGLSFKIDRLLSRISIIDIVRDYSSKVSSSGSGKYMVSCPFHKDGQEQKPSMSVDDSKGVYYCFACGAKGNALSFIRDKMGYEFKESVKYLGKRFGVDVSEFFSPQNQKKIALSDKLYEVNQKAMNLYGKYLYSKNENGYLFPEAALYLKKRGISPSLAKKFKLGFAPPNWDALTLSMRNGGYDIRILLEAGLTNKSKNGKKYYDKFINRIIFPIIDGRGNVLGFGGRSIDATEPKYLNSPETKIFRKKYVLYGINHAIESIREKDEALIVEGYMDVIAAHLAGINNAVGTLGTAFGANHLRILSKHTKNIVFAFDNDEAGKRASFSAIEIAVSMGFNVYILPLKEAKDIDEYLSSHSKEDFDKVYSKKQTWYDYMLKVELEKFPNMTINEKVQASANLFTVVKSVQNGIARAEIIRYIAEKLGIEVSATVSEFNKYMKKQKVTVAIADNNTDEKSRPKENRAERELVYLLIINPKYISEVSKKLLPSDFDGVNAKEIYTRLISLEGDVEMYDALEVIGNASIAGRVKEYAMRNEYTVDVKRNIDDCVLAIKKRDIIEEQKAIDENIEDQEINWSENIDTLAQMLEKKISMNKRLMDNDKETRD